jgi:hypothetical protein
MTVNERIQSATVEELIEWWTLEEPPDWAKETHLFLDKLASALSRVGPKGTSFLKSQAETEHNSKKQFLAIYSLACRGVADADVIRYLFAAFRKDHAGWRDAALEGFVSVKHYPLARSEVEAVLDVSAAAIVYMSYAYPAEAVELLRGGLRSRHHWIRGKACTESGSRNFIELRREVEQLLDDEDDFVARSAQIGCEFFKIAAMRGC